jgi:hypothetical protein
MRPPPARCARQPDAPRLGVGDTGYAGHVALLATLPAPVIAVAIAVVVLNVLVVAASFAAWVEQRRAAWLFRPRRSPAAEVASHAPASAAIQADARQLAALDVLVYDERDWERSGAR